MFAQLMMLLATAIPPPPVLVVNIPHTDVVYAYIGDILPVGALDGRPDLFVQRGNGDTYLTEFDDLEVHGDYVRALLYMDSNSPTIFRSSYVDREGDRHEIVTNCTRFGESTESLTLCATHHSRAIAALKAIFPKKAVDDGDGPDRVIHD